MVTHWVVCVWYVQVEAGNTAEGAIAAAGALIVPSPQSCLRHRCGGVHQTSCITLACDRKHDYNNSVLFSNMHLDRLVRAHASSTRRLGDSVLLCIIPYWYMTNDDGKRIIHRLEKARLKQYFQPRGTCTIARKLKILAL